MRPYHVLKKNGQWHLYVGNDSLPVFVHPSRSAVLNHARGRARKDGSRVIVHRPLDEDGSPS